MKPQMKALLVLVLAGTVLTIMNAGPAVGADRYGKAGQVADGYGDFYNLFIQPGDDSTDREITRSPVIDLSDGGERPLGWSVPEARLPNSISWLAAFVDKGIRFVLKLVAAIAITSPIPGAALLLGTGILCLIGLRRRDRPQA